jgi:hypothetical protein
MKTKKMNALPLAVSGARVISQLHQSKGKRSTHIISEKKKGLVASVEGKRLVAALT